MRWKTDHFIIFCFISSFPNEITTFQVIYLLSYSSIKTTGTLVFFLFSYLPFSSLLSLSSTVLRVCNLIINSKRVTHVSCVYNFYFNITQQFTIFFSSSHVASYHFFCSGFGFVENWLIDFVLRFNSLFSFALYFNLSWSLVWSILFDLIVFTLRVIIVFECVEKCQFTSCLQNEKLISSSSVWFDQWWSC